MKYSDEQKWAVNPTKDTTLPLISPVRWRGGNERRWQNYRALTPS